MHATKYLTIYILSTSVSLLLFIPPDGLFEITPISYIEKWNSGRSLAKDFWPYRQAAVSGAGCVKNIWLEKGWVDAKAQMRPPLNPYSVLASPSLSLSP